MSAAEAYNTVSGGYAGAGAAKESLDFLRGRPEQPVLRFVPPKPSNDDDGELSERDSEILQRATGSVQHEPRAAVQRRGVSDKRRERTFVVLAIGSASLAIAGFLTMLLAWAMGYTGYLIPASIVGFGFTLISGITLEVIARIRGRARMKVAPR